MFTLGLIFARAGSKGLPDKCVRTLLGRPLIEFTFDHARSSRRINALVLTTDSTKAKQLARARGIEVIDRPATLASDTARIDAAARHAVESWETAHGRRIDAVVLLYANVPVRADGVIDRCITHLESTHASSVRTVAPIGRHHPDWLHKLSDDRMTQYRANGTFRRQDLEPLHYHDGAVAVATRSALFDASAHGDDGQAFLGTDRRAIVQKPEDAVDVDEAVDLAVAEAVLRNRAIGGFPSVGGATAPHVRIIAEAGVNHDGALDKALKLVDAAVAAGADAVKFQVFRADELASAGAPQARYQERAGASSQRDMLRKLELPDAALARVHAHCRSANIEFLATPFGIADVDRLVALDVRAVKIASTDIDNLPLLRKVAGTGLQLIVSRGAATREEIARAVGWLHEFGAFSRTTLLHCVSCYPTPIEAANLRAIAVLRDAFGLPAGFSDHTRGIRTGAWAVAAGALLLEKHLTLDCSDAGPDHAISLEPDQMRDYIDAARDIEAALGTGVVGMTDAQVEVRRVARKSIVAARDLPAGTALTADMLALKRPGGGISPAQLEAVLGKVLGCALPADAMLTFEMLTGSAAAAAAPSRDKSLVAGALMPATARAAAAPVARDAGAALHAGS